MVNGLKGVEKRIENRGWSNRHIANSYFCFESTCFLGRYCEYRGGRCRRDYFSNW